MNTSKTLMLNEAEGRRTWLTVTEEDPYSKKVCLTVTTTDEISRTPDEHRMKAKLFLTREELSNLAKFLAD